MAVLAGDPTAFLDLALPTSGRTRRGIVVDDPSLIRDMRTIVGRAHVHCDG